MSPKSSLQVLALLLACSMGYADTVNYDLIFDSTWSAETHPNAFPTNAHYSGTVVATHSAEYSMWAPGVLSSPGMKRIAEQGGGDILAAEVQAAIEAGTAGTFSTLPAINNSPRSAMTRVPASSTHTLVSFASMIAPSPDWIVGAHDISLVDEQGNWLPEIVMDVLPYDAGTDSGVDFTSANLATDPFVPLFGLSDQDPFTGTGTMGTFTLRLTSLPGDFNGSGAVGVGDIDVLCFRLGESHPNFELSGDDNISMDDVNQLVERVMGTRAGDTNLDGEVDFNDFLTLSGNFDSSTNWSGGDFNCDRQVGFEDFLTLSRNFGFSRDDAAAAATASVPEPATGVLLLVGLVAGSMVRRRR